MFKDDRLYGLYLESSLHVGSGTSLGAIDLPIQREKATNLPMVPGSSVKGALRELTRMEGKTWENQVFGPEADVRTTTIHYAGAASFADLQLLYFPVKSLRETFVWVTSPYLIQRFLGKIPKDPFASKKIPEVTEETCLIAEGASDLIVNNKVILEEFAFNANAGSYAGELGGWLARILEGKPDYIQKKAKKHVVVVSDTVMDHFVSYSMPVTARIQIEKDTRTAENLWYEEFLPPETVFIGKVASTTSCGFEKTPSLPSETVLTELGNLPSTFMLGGDKTTGRGWVTVKWL